MSSGGRGRHPTESFSPPNQIPHQPGVDSQAMTSMCNCAETNQKQLLESLCVAHESMTTVVMTNSGQDICTVDILANQTID